MKELDQSKEKSPRPEWERVKAEAKVFINHGNGWKL